MGDFRLTLDVEFKEREPIPRIFLIHETQTDDLSTKPLVTKIEISPESLFDLQYQLTEVLALLASLDKFLNDRLNG